MSQLESGRLSKFNEVTMTLDVDEMSLSELRQIIKMLARNLNMEHDRINDLQDKILELEMSLDELKKS